MIELLLFLLLAYGIVTVGLLWWRKLNTVILVSCSLISLALGYCAFTYNSEVMLGLFYPPPGPEEAFASVKSIMRDVPFSAQLRYYFEAFGWLIGFVYFGLLYLISYALVQITYAKTT